MSILATKLSSFAAIFQITAEYFRLAEEMDNEDALDLVKTLEIWLYITRNGTKCTLYIIQYSTIYSSIEK